ncbi:MAG: TAXI family TRAP transporter solute-binding subunit [Usitatibacter sp.]
MSKSISAIAAALLLTSCAGTPPMSTTPLTVSLATATPGGGFPVYGAAFAAAIRQADPTLTIETRNTKGSAENVPLLEQGKVDLGLVQGEAAYEALAGINRSGPANMKILWAMYSSPGMFVVRSDSTARKIEDLKGKSVAWGAQGSGLVLLGGYVVDGLGMNRDRDFKAIYLEKAGDGPAMVQDGRAAALWGGGIGWPGFTTMANSAAGARFIAPSNAQIDTILKKHSFMRRVTIPAGAYKGIEQDLPSVGSWSFVFARTDLPEETAYRVARALHKAQGELGNKLAQAKESTAANTAAAADPKLLHPGVARYLRDAGISR